MVTAWHVNPMAHDMFSSQAEAERERRDRLYQRVLEMQAAAGGVGGVVQQFAAR